MGHPDRRLTAAPSCPLVDRRRAMIMPSNEWRAMSQFDALPGASYSAPMATKSSSTNAVAAIDRGRGDRVVTSNRRAFHDFHILESVEAGIVLTGTEIKSIRDGKATIAEAYARFENVELWLIEIGRAHV